MTDALAERLTALLTAVERLRGLGRTGSVPPLVLARLLLAVDRAANELTVLAGDAEAAAGKGGKE